MISPIRSLCFNDDRQTFTIVLPSQYRIFRCDPFGMIFSRECEDLSLGSVATYHGYRLIALTGSPSPSSSFNSKCVRIFDHQNGQVTFEHTFPDHILTLQLGNDVVVIAMHCKVEVWNTKTNQMIHNFGTGLNVHVPLTISKDSSAIITAGGHAKQLSISKGIGATLKTSTLTADDNPISLVRFSDDGQFFASASFNGTRINIFDARTFSLMAILDRGANDIIQTMDFSPNGDYIASCSKDATIRIFDIRRKMQNTTKTTPPVCQIKIELNKEQTISMPRLEWLNSALIGLTSLDGDYYKLNFTGMNVDYEKSTFLKRSG